MPILLRAKTICSPPLMLVRVEGEKQSPEKRVIALGFYLRSSSTLALKWQIPIDPPFGCRS